MKAVIQRVKLASVTIDGKPTAQIAKGMVVLLGIAQGDTPTGAQDLANKISTLRIFEDSQGKMNLSLKDINGEVLVVPQFTLLADLSKGRRPSFERAAGPEIAQGLCKDVVQNLKGLGLDVEEGRFGADMVVNIHNDGPVTFVLEI